MERAPNRLNTYGKPIRMWRCICDCGGETVTSTSKLATTRSCGCLRLERVREVVTTHGHKARGKVSGEYHSWAGMIARTTNRSHKRWDTWGGRGIDIDPRYCGPGGFENFLADIGPRPSLRHSIERQNNSRGYWPDNIRWATPKEQSRNQRSTVMVEWDGRRMSLRDAADEVGLPFSCVYLRYHRRGWSLERTLTEPLRSGGRVK